MVGVSDSDGVLVGRGVRVGVIVTVGVVVWVGVDVVVGVLVWVAVAVGVGVLVEVGVDVNVGVAVTVGVAVANSTNLGRGVFSWVNPTTPITAASIANKKGLRSERRCLPWNRPNDTANDFNTKRKSPKFERHLGRTTEGVLS